MPRKRILTPGASPLHFFGAEVRHAREAAGISQVELGKIVNCDDSVVSRVEGGIDDPPEGFAEACDKAFPGMGGFFTRFYNDSRRWEGPFPASFRPFVSHEAVATLLRWYEHSLVPGLLQTEAYARAVLGTRPNTSQDEIDELVAARMARQDVLSRHEPPLLYALLDEGVLYRDVGSREIMHAQLIHLVEMSKQPNITVQVVPYSAGAHSGLLGAFVIAEVADSPAIAYLETAAEGETVAETAVVTHIMLNFDTLRSEALPHGASRDMIGRVAQERWMS
jgi:transcriptional regulator with XRE-family HTH domain